MLIRLMGATGLALAISLGAAAAQTSSTGSSGTGGTAGPGNTGSTIDDSSGSGAPNQNGYTTLPDARRGNEGSSGKAGDQVDGASEALTDKRRYSDSLSRDSGSAMERTVIPPSNTEAPDTGTTGSVN